MPKRFISLLGEAVRALPLQNPPDSYSPNTADAILK